MTLSQLDPLTPAQQALLSACAYLERNDRPVDSSVALQEVDAFGPDWFGMYLLDWSGAYDRLAEQQLIVMADGALTLTPAGIEQARSLKDGHPRFLYAYNEFFHRARKSAAHSRFCERVYGRDLCQYGMMDMQQLDDLVFLLKQDKARNILELGCGNGAVAAYIADQTGATITGVDIAEEGIHWAQEYTAARPGQLEFTAADMTSVAYPPGTFDAVLMIDAIYFVPDLCGFIHPLMAQIKKKGKLYAFYSHHVDEAAKRRELRAMETPLARALNALCLLDYTFLDCSGAEAEHWRLKHRVAEEMKDDFLAEGNEWLWHRRWIETVYHTPYVEGGNVSRYLYRIRN